jgi:hypothetical protein
MIEINCYGGRIGRFWWVNSGCGSRYFPSFRPGRCGWRESWPDETACWPVSPWGKGNPADDYFRDFAAFELWFDCMIKKCNLDEIDFTITNKTEMYSLFVGVFVAGVEAGQNPWRWAKGVEARLLRQAVEPADREVGP